MLGKVLGADKASLNASVASSLSLSVANTPLTSLLLVVVGLSTASPSNRSICVDSNAGALPFSSFLDRIQSSTSRGEVCELRLTSSGRFPSSAAGFGFGRGRAGRGGSAAASAILPSRAR